MSAVTDRADALCAESAKHELEHWRTEGVLFGGQRIPPDLIERVERLSDRANVVKLKERDHVFIVVHSAITRPATA